MRIQKASETMTAKERVLKTFNLERTDRVTIGYEANAAVHRRFSEALGIPDHDMEKTYQALGVDYRSIPVRYIGPELFRAPEGRRVNPVEGCVMRWVEHETGGSVNVLNLVEGEEAVVESPEGKFAPFVVHYAETFIVPAAVGRYTVAPYGKSIGKNLATVKAFVRV